MSSIRSQFKYSYSSLAKQEAEILIECAEEIVSLYKTTLESIIKIGKALLKAKESVSHGVFLDWLTTELGDLISHDTAENAMNVAYEWERNPNYRQAMSKMSLSSIYKLATSKVPEVLKQTVYEAVDSGLTLNREQLQDIKTLYREFNVLTSEVSKEAAQIIVESVVSDSPEQLKKLASLPSAKQVKVAEILATGKVDSVRGALHVLKQANTQSNNSNPQSVSQEVKGNWITGLNELVDSGVKAQIIFAECPLKYEWLSNSHELVRRAEELLEPGGFLLAVVGHKAIMSLSNYLAPLEPLHVLTLRRQPGKTKTIVGINIACASVLIAVAYKKPYRAPSTMLVDLHTIDIESGIEKSLERIFSSLVVKGSSVIHVKCTPNHFGIEEAVVNSITGCGGSTIYTVG